MGSSGVSLQDTLVLQKMVPVQVMAVTHTRACFTRTQEPKSQPKVQEWLVLAVFSLIPHLCGFSNILGAPASP